MNIANLVVTKGLVAASSNKLPQLIQITAETIDVHNEPVQLTWRNVGQDGATSEPFATATLHYGEPTSWMGSWVPTTHLIQSRIQDLERMAAEGKASRFSNKMAYTLFAANLVDYAEKYRGMQSVVMNGLEAFADVQLSTKEGGIWTVPPYFIDSVAHLAGFIMNCSDAMDVKNNFCVTPGWASMRFAKPLTAGAKYRSYVKMIPTVEDPQVYLGDVYILQDDEIIGMVGGIKFRRYPRLLISKFFSAPEAGGGPIEAAKPETTTPAPKAAPKAAPTEPAVPVNKEPTPPLTPDGSEDGDLPMNKPSAKPDGGAKKAAAAASNEPATPTNGIVAQALDLIANEACVDKSELGEDVAFADLGVDSLMSLVIAEKFQTLGVKVSGSLFLDYEKVGDLTGWLEEYHS
jgi:monodictyphenone polyketide synthase